MTIAHHKSVAILVGGGPAPGINSVISAATIRVRARRRRGRRHPRRLRVDDAGQHRARHAALTIEAVSRIHFRGGSHIGISRANPTLDPEHLEQTVISLLRLNVSQLITIGGDDTAYSAMKLEEKAAGPHPRRRTCRRRSTTISTCRTTSTRSASRRRAITASRSSRT